MVIMFVDNGVTMCLGSNGQVYCWENKDAQVKTLDMPPCLSLFNSRSTCYAIDCNNAVHQISNQFTSKDVTSDLLQYSHQKGCKKDECQCFDVAPKFTFSKGNIVIQTGKKLSISENSFYHCPVECDLRDDIDFVIPGSYEEFIVQNEQPSLVYFRDEDCFYLDFDGYYVKRRIPATQYKKVCQVYSGNCGYYYLLAKDNRVFADFPEATRDIDGNEMEPYQWVLRKKDVYDMITFSSVMLFHHLDGSVSFECRDVNTISSSICEGKSFEKVFKLGQTFSLVNGNTMYIASYQNVGDYKERVIEYQELHEYVFENKISNVSASYDWIVITDVCGQVFQMPIDCGKCDMNQLKRIEFFDDHPIMRNVAPMKNARKI